MKYLNEDKRTGGFNYRRRVPKQLAKRVPQKFFIKLLGKTQSEALMNYGAYHAYVENLVALAKNGATGLSPREQSERLTAMLKSWGADPDSSGLDDNERTWREVAADKLIDQYQDELTGEYVGVPEEDAVIARALISGAPKGELGTTITDAFKFYLSENALTDPQKLKKQQQKFKRAELQLLSVVGSDILVSDLTKEHVRKWRDMRLLEGVQPSTVRRERSNISTVISTAISELNAGHTNPFFGMKLPKSVGNRSKERDALPSDVLVNVYNELEEKPDLLNIWTLLDFTGARPSEIRMLRVSEVVLEHAVPHVIIQEWEDRTLKTGWSERLVPLVGDALRVAQKVVRGRNDTTAFLFPSYASGGGDDRLSQALNRRVRKFTKNPKHVTYSLRHNMKDRMRAAEVFGDTQKAIEGHAYGSGQDASYGGAVSLEQKQGGLLDAMKGYRDCSKVAE